MCGSWATVGPPVVGQHFRCHAVVGLCGSFGGVVAREPSLRWRELWPSAHASALAADLFTANRYFALSRIFSLSGILCGSANPCCPIAYSGGVLCCSAGPNGSSKRNQGEDRQRHTVQHQVEGFRDRPRSIRVQKPAADGKWRYGTHFPRKHFCGHELIGGG
jgi:hypothetical protein